MTEIENYDNLAGIQFRNLEKSNPNGYGNDHLRVELGKLGVGTLIIPNVDAYNLNRGTVLAHPTTGESKMSIGSLQEFPIKPGGIEVVRSRILTPDNLEDFTPVLNGRKLRAIGASKFAQYEIAPDYAPRTVAVEEGQNPDESVLDDLVGNTLVVKADMSQDSRNMAICTRSEVINAISAIRDDFIEAEKEKGKSRTNKRIIIQEFIPGRPWLELRGVDEKSKQMLTDADATELRMYCYVDKAKQIPFDQRYFATARAFKDDDDEWVSVDQTSVPASAWQIADEVSDRLLAKANVPGGYFAIDLIKSRTLDDMDERLFVREINTRDPMMVEEEDNYHDYLKQRQMLANAMAVVARSK